MQIPPLFTDILKEFRPIFTKPTYNRFIVIAMGSILSVGRRTISNILRTIDEVAPGDNSCYRYFFSKRQWSSFKFSKILCSMIFKLLNKDSKILIAMDDTVAERPGTKVWGKGKHRDGVRSSHKYIAYKWGHKWVVLSIVVKLSISKRPWALPILIGLYRSKDWDEKHKTRHRTPSEIARILLGLLCKWFPDRIFVAIGDTGFGNHAMSRFCASKINLNFISKFYKDAVLHTSVPPKTRAKNGFPQYKGKRIDSPEEVVEKTLHKKSMTVSWYGGAERKIEIVEGAGHWYRQCRGLVEIKWVFVRDLTGTHRDEYFYTTDMSLTASEIVEGYTCRWSIETTFQEVREYLKIESTRCFTQKSVNRMVPGLFCLYSLIVILFMSLPSELRTQHQLLWNGKNSITFSDMIITLRKYLWEHWIIQNPCINWGFVYLPPPLRNILLRGLASAA